mgnify:CR=1 FL=1
MAKPETVRPAIAHGHTADTFPKLLLEHAARRPQAPAMREKEYGIWQTITWSAMAELVQNVAAGLHQAGLRRDDHMIVVGANRPRLYATMLAIQSIGAIPIPLYQDAAAPECGARTRPRGAASLMLTLMMSPIPA